MWPCSSRILAFNIMVGARHGGGGGGGALLWNFSVPGELWEAYMAQVWGIELWVVSGFVEH